MKSRSFLRPILVVLMGVGLVYGLGGCIADQHALPTLGGKPKEKGSELVIAAKLYYDCMDEAGIEMEMVTNNDGQLALVLFNLHSGFVLTSNKGGGSAMMSEETTPSQQQMIDDFFTNMGDEPRLNINGVDYSETYAHCLDISGYDENAAYGYDSYMMDPADMERSVRANNEWAACVRENGFPGVKDSAMPAKMDGSEWPSITLPGTISEDQLRSLIEACPNFDPDLEERRSNYWNENPMATALPDDLLPDPSIQFDFGDPPSSDKSEEPSAAQLAEQDRIGRLYDILYEKQNEYWNKQER